LLHSHEHLFSLRPVVSVTSANVDPTWEHASGTALVSADYVVSVRDGTLYATPTGSLQAWSSAYRANKVVVVAGFTACPPALAFKYLNFTSQGGVGTGDCNFSFWLFGTQPGLTGFVLLLIMIFIYGGANETIRRGSDAQRSAPPPAQTGDRSGSTAKAPVKTLSAAASNRCNQWVKVWA
jgi:hypothetical protein